MKHVLYLHVYTSIVEFLSHTLCDTMNFLENAIKTMVYIKKKISRKCPIIIFQIQWRYNLPIVISNWNCCKRIIIDRNGIKLSTYEILNYMRESLTYLSNCKKLAKTGGTLCAR